MGEVVEGGVVEEAGVRPGRLSLHNRYSRRSQNANVVLNGYAEARILAMLPL